jgi:hypothetical protein
MGYNGTAYVRLWDMPARASLSLTFFDFPFNESFCFFEVGGRCHLGLLSPAHPGTASSAPNLIKTRRPPAISGCGPPQSPRLCGPNRRQPVHAHSKRLPHGVIRTDQDRTSGDHMRGGCAGSDYQLTQFVAKFL